MSDKPPKRAPKMDWSGHVTMNHQQSNFYQEAEHKALLTMAKQRAGMVDYRPFRNPVLAEKTPRSYENNFDFSVPSARAETERWKYPSEDWGLMSKFASQKPAFDKMKQLQNTYSEKVDAYKEKLETMALQQKEQTTSRTLASSRAGEEENPLNSQRNTSRSTARHPSEPLFSSRDGYLSDRVLLEPGEQENTKTSRHPSQHALSKSKQPSQLSDFHASLLKTMQQSNPDLLERYRCDRAAEYVNRLSSNLLELPKHHPSANEIRPFRPPGEFATTSMNSQTLKDSKKRHKNASTSSSLSAVAHSSARGAAGASTVSATSRIPSSRVETLEVLMEELDKTNGEIQQQELLLALKAKTKGYELNNTSRRNMMK